MNKVYLLGRVTKDLELRATPSGTQVMQFTIATDNGKDKDGNKKPADFHDCVAWEKRAETLSKYLKKGDSILIIGANKTDKYQDKNGENRYKKYVLVDGFEFLPRAREEHIPIKENTETQTTDNQIESDPFKEFGDTVVLTDDELPF